MTLILRWWLLIIIVVIYDYNKHLIFTACRFLLQSRGWRGAKGEKIIVVTIGSARRMSLIIYAFMINYIKDRNLIRIMKKVFDNFIWFSSLITNPYKSHVFFSEVDDEFKIILHYILGFRLDSLLIRYLGVLLIFTRLTHLLYALSGANFLQDQVMDFKFSYLY